LDQGAADGRDRLLDQLRAVVDRHHADAGRQAPLHCPQLLYRRRDHLVRVFAVPGDDDTGNDVTAAVEIGGAATLVRTERDGGDVLDPDRGASLAGGEHDVLEIGARRDVAVPAHHVFGAAEID